VVYRILRPAGFVVAGLLMFLPFITVSCDVPGGYGRAAPGGTSEYTGFDLVFGGEPTINPADKVRDGVAETLAPQPLSILAVLLLIVGIVITFRVRDALVRRATISLLSGMTAIALLTSQLTVQTHLQTKVGAKYVHNQPGFWLCLATLVVVMFANAVAWLRSASHR
jgi:hypothetical protein